MARHRVGDSYLSDAEYSQHQKEIWLAIVFIGGALLGGFGIYWLCPSDWPKQVRFFLVITLSFGAGTIATWLNAEILWLFKTGLTLFIGYQLLQFLWSVI